VTTWKAKQALQLIRQAQHILVVTHVSPDGDAIGSLLAMGNILRRLGKKHVTLACDDPAPEKFAFLPGVERIVQACPPSERDACDLILALDSSDAARGGEAYLSALREGVQTICIDHHITNTQFADLNIVMVDAAATTEALYRLLPDWGLDLDRDMALCLLTGLVTDTLCFRTANVTSQVMQVAADLMAAGADLSLVTSQTVNRRSIEAVAYWGHLLTTLQLDEHVASVFARANGRQAAGFGIRGDASIVTLLITAVEADMAASFVEQEDGRVEISLRAKPNFDVSEIALSLGGGGHPAAAGCTVAGPLDEAMERVLGLLKTARQTQAKAKTVARQ
jgi:bifunctional oligoribonuclease and PAP phosphatase NrnA